MGAYKGSDVVAAAMRGRPDAFIFDMPGLSGYSVARAIREIYGDATPLLIAISGRWVGQTDKMLAELAAPDEDTTLDGRRPAAPS